MQNERQPRNSAQVRQDQVEAELENPMAASNTTVSATHPAFTPGHGPGDVGNVPGPHRFMSALTSTEPRTKQEVDDTGECASCLSHNRN